MRWRLLWAVALVGSAVSVLGPSAQAEEPVGGTYVPVTSSRLYSTRTGQGGRTTPLNPGEEVAVPVAGKAGVPGAGAAAVAITVSVHSPTGPGYLKLWASGAAMPNTSNVNFDANQTAGNYAVVPIGTDGQIKVLNAGAGVGTTDVIIDVHGWVSALTDTQAPGRYQPVTAQRLVDTRYANSVRSTPVASQEPWSVRLTNFAGVPATGVSAVALNVTVPAPQLTGWSAIHATGTPRPPTASLQYVQGISMASFVMAPVDANGYATIYNSGPGVMNAIIDIQGYVTAGSDTSRGGMIEMLHPTRIVDTRTGLGGRSTPLGQTPMAVTIRGAAGVPLEATLSDSVVVQVTAVSPTSDGYITVWPSGVTRPSVSHQNFAANGPSRGAFVITKIGADGKIQVYNSNGSTGILVDVLGYVTPREPNDAPNPPANLLPAAGAVVAEASPELAATVSDPEKDRVTTAWSIRNAATQAAVISSVTGQEAASGVVARFRAPAGVLLNGVGYEWQVSACDGTACTSSAWRAFSTNGVNPLPLRPEEPAVGDEQACHDDPDVEADVNCVADVSDDPELSGVVGPSLVWSYSGQQFSTAPTNDVVVLEETIQATSTGSWRASGLVRNELFQAAADGITVIAHLRDAAGAQIGTASTLAADFAVRPGEPVPFTVASAVPPAEVVWVDGEAARPPVADPDDRMLRSVVYWEKPYSVDRARELVDVGFYVEDPAGTGPLPLVIFGEVTNDGTTTVATPRLVGAWIDQSGKILATVNVPVTDEFGVPVSLPPGGSGFILITQDDASLAPMLGESQFVTWEVAA